jgi:hypothetical protein
MRRAVGYCQKDQCDDYAKGVFLLNHGQTFLCPRCREDGEIAPEVGAYTGTSDVFKEVRVEYNYCAVNHEFREIAIVRDESLWGRCNTYVLKSPLIKTERRALKVAEAILSNLNKFSRCLADLNSGEVPTTLETILNFDQDMATFKSNLAKFAKELEASPLARRRVDELDD